MATGMNKRGCGPGQLPPRRGRGWVPTEEEIERVKARYETCDGCGASVLKPADQKKLPDGWMLHVHGDNERNAYCPKCSAAL